MHGTPDPKRLEELVTLLQLVGVPCKEIVKPNPETQDFAAILARERGLDALYLTVNKHNEMAIRAYKAKGFEVIDAVETDIGDGYIMADYIMEKKLQ